MQLGIIREVSVQKVSRLQSRNTFLTSRDLEIIEFLIDMKFASSSEVFEKFFKVTTSNTQAKSDEWTKKRLIQLKQGGFLVSHRSHSERTTYYCSTFKGYYALASVYPERSVCKPISGFDSRTFKHDHLVLQCRLDLESQWKITNWVSDRKLRSDSELSGGLTGVHVPDGIFTLPSGLRVAFELEIARKEKSRYADKVKKYVQVMRSLDPSKRRFDCVQFVCTKETVKELLVKETKIFGALFQVQTMNEFICSLKGETNAEAI